MGDPKAIDDKLWEVLEHVNLAAFLRTENGLDTVVLEKGSNFSGGQCQRLALARALLHDSPVYIFDEATSNIDVESENDIIAEMLRMAQTRSVFVISHRLANITKANQIYVMEKGMICESGTQDELLAKKGVYKKSVGNTAKPREVYEIRYESRKGEVGMKQAKKRSNFQIMSRLIGLVKTAHWLYGACHFNGSCRAFVRKFYYYSWRLWCVTCAWHKDKRVTWMDFCTSCRICVGSCRSSIWRAKLQSFYRI